MESEATRETFGSYLRTFRLKRDLAIETVSRKTKIALHCLRAMEQSDTARLPPKAYVKSFIRAYADVVGANAEVALDLYLSDLRRQALARQQFLKRQAKMRVLRRILMAVGLIASILLLVRYTDIFPDASPPLRPEASSPVTFPEPANAVTEPDTGHLTGTKTQEKLELRVLAVEPTWLKVMVDGQNARSYELKPEERLELEGTDSFNLMIGSATGLRIFLNEQPVKIYGSSGQVVSLKIP